MTSMYICIFLHICIFIIRIGSHNYRSWEVLRSTVGKLETQGLQSESKGLRTRRTYGVISSPKANRLKTQEEPRFQSKTGKDQFPAQGSQVGGVPSFSAFLFYSGLQLIRWGSPTLGRRICFTQLTNSNINLIQIHPHRHTQNNVWTSVTLWPSQVDT